MSGTFNNIRIDRSTVGVVNTGSIEKVDVAVTAIRGAGDEPLAEAIQRLTEAVSASAELPEAKKTEALQMLEVVSAEATQPKENRRAAAIRPVLSGLGETIKVSASLASLWHLLSPIILAAF